MGKGILEFTEKFILFVSLDEGGSVEVLERTLISKVSSKLPNL